MDCKAYKEDEILPQDAVRWSKKQEFVLEEEATEFTIPNMKEDKREMSFMSRRRYDLIKSDSSILFYSFANLFVIKAETNGVCVCV